VAWRRQVRLPGTAAVHPLPTLDDTPRAPPAASGFWGKCRRSQPPEVFALKASRSRPRSRLPDVLDFPYTGNKLHPTQKPVAALKPLIAAFCPPQGSILDTFAGSGSALVAAKQLGRQYVGIALDEQHHRTASTRLEGAQALAA
jgi:DNA modification methylase